MPHNQDGSHNVYLKTAQELGGKSTVHYHVKSTRHYFISLKMQGHGILDFRLCKYNYANVNQKKYLGFQHKGSYIITWQQ